MKYKTSFLSRHIILEDLKRYWGIAALYLLISFTTGPLEIVSALNRPNGINIRLVKSVMGITGSEIQFILAISYPVLLSILIYRYLQQSRSATLMHSFPITRKELFHSHNIAGFLLISIPILINTIVLLIIWMTYNGDNATFIEIFTASRILTWMGVLLLVNFIVYLMGSTIAMITGISMIQGILSMIFLFFPIGLGELIRRNFEQLIYGFAINLNNYNNTAASMSPGIGLLSGDSIDGSMIIWYLILGVILYLVSYYLYQKRQLERASDSIAFKIMKPIFKYGVTFCTMLLLGAYFSSLMKTTLWLYVGYGIGGFLGYIIAEMIIQKSIWVFKNIKGFIIYSLIIVIVFLGIKGDVIGYEGRMPELEDVHRAYYGSGLYNYWYTVSDEVQITDMKKGVGILKDIDNIESVMHLHEHLLENKDKFTNIERSGYIPTIGIVYELKNGRKIVREYKVTSEFIKSNQYIKEICESREYKVSYYDIFDLDVEKLNYIEFQPYASSVKERVKIIDTSELKEIITVFKSDLLDETYEELIDYRNNWGYANLYYENENDSSKLETIYIEWKRSYEGLAKWLKEKGYYEQLVITPEQVEHIVVQEISEDLDINEFLRTIDMEKLDKDKDISRIVAKKSYEIEKILNKCNFGYSPDKKYVLGIYLKNGKKILGSMN